MRPETLGAFLDGIILAENFGIAAFFIRFWRKTGDGLFGYFSLAFAALGLERLVIFALSPPNESSPPVYLIRMGAFLLIIAAIIRKNLVTRS